MTKQPQLAPSNGGVAALLRASPRAPYLISTGEPTQPSEEAHFHHLYPQSHSVGHYSRHVAIGEGWNVDT